MAAEKKIHPPRIHKLPASLANQIAAGEVIERPASVVKELLENSLDAGATTIQIDIEKGGSRQIRVSDNGHGIHPDDIQLALEQHATSKLREQADLQGISSLGFRGEALPSIASVSQFKLVSRCADMEQAWSVRVDQWADKFECLPAAHPVGTSIEVNHLFHVTPARRKFLSSERTEYAHILEMVRRLALANADVSLRLRHNDKQVLYCPNTQGDPAERMAAIMGSGFGQKARFVNDSDRRMRLWGWLGSPGQSRNQSDRQYFYLNGRMIRDRRVNHAIRLAYKSLLPPGRYPCYVLYLEMDAAAADVNVHPSKHEVRFRQARNVHDFIYASVQGELSKGAGLALDAAGKSSYALPSPPTFYKRTGDLAERSGHYAALMNSRQDRGLLADRPQSGYPIAQLQGRFIITALEQGFGLIDVRSARRHIARARLQNPQSVRQRPLLVPLTLSLSQAEVERLTAAIGLLQQYGLILEAVSLTAIMIRAMPLVLQDADIQHLLTDILQVLDKNNSVQLVDVMAAHAADIEEDKIEVSESLNLLRSLDELGLGIDDQKNSTIGRCLTLEDFAALLSRDA